MLFKYLKFLFTICVLLATSKVHAKISYWQLEKSSLEDVRNLNTDTYNCAIFSGRPGNDIKAQGKLCSGTVISQDQVLFNENCRQKLNRAQVGRVLKLSCLSGAIESIIPITTGTKGLGAMKLAKLRTPLPILPPTLIKHKDQAEKLKECVLITPLRKQKIKNLSSIKRLKVSPSEVGAAISCLNENGERAILGFFNDLSSFSYIWDNEELKQKINTEFQMPPAQDQRSFMTSCKESVNCLNELQKEVEELSGDIIKIITHLNEDLVKTQDKITQRVNELQLNNLKEEFDEIRHRCYQAANELKLRSDDEVDTNWRDSLMGLIEGGAIATVDGFTAAVNFTPIDWDYNFLLNQFKDVEILKENLTEEEFKSIYLKVERDNKKASNVERIKKLTGAYAQKVVTKIAKDLDIGRGHEEIYDSLDKNLIPPFKKCLSSAVDKETVLECADKFSLTAAVKIAKIELDNQLNENFATRFNEDEFELVKKRSHQIYERCINQYYYDDRLQKDISSSDKAKACVYESILAAYEKTKEKELNITLAGLFNQEERKEIIKDIEKEARNCHLGNIINSPERLTKSQYKTLSLLEIDDYKSSLFSCVEKLSIRAGEHVIKRSIETNPQVVEYSGSTQEISKLTQRLLTNEYRQCLDYQSNRENKDPQACSDLITAVTTVNVATKALEKNVTELFSSQAEIDTNMKEISAIMNRCEKEIGPQLLDAIREERTIDYESKVTACLSASVDIIVRNLTPQKISESLDENPGIAKYKEEILAMDEVKGLTAFTQKCFKDSFSQLRTIDEFTSNLDEIQEKCIFETEKRATDKIALLVMEKELLPVLEDRESTKALIEKYYNGDQGLALRISQAKNKEELNRIVALITPELTQRAAKEVIPSMTAQYLSEATKEDKKRIQAELLGHIETCIEETKKYENDKIDKGVNRCMNTVSAKGHILIGETLINENIESILGDFPQASQKLKKNSKRRITQCIGKLSQDLQKEKYSQALEECLSNEIYTLSHSIPREAWLSYAKNTTTNYSQELLEAKLLEVERYFRITGDYKREIRDPLIANHVSLLRCLSQKRANLKKRGNHSVAKVLETYPACTDKIEDQVKGEVATKFSHDHAPRDGLGKDFKELGLILTSLTGEASSSNTGSSQSASQSKDSVSDAFRMMNLIGTKMAATCTFNEGDCRKSIAQTKVDISDYKKKNPQATGDQLVNRFIDSPLMDEVIKAELAATLRVELIKGLKDYKDSEGILEGVLKDISSPESINQLIATPYGNEILRLVKNEIKNDNLDNVGNNKKLRRALANAITYNTGNNSFVDKLMYAIVQPTLNSERRKSNGVFGIFKNFKVALGRALRIVKARNFKWEKIRETKEGRVARDIFAKQIFAPIINGEDLERSRATDKKSKNLLEQKSKQVEDLIIKGLMSL